MFKKKPPPEVVADDPNDFNELEESGEDRRS